MRSRSRCEAGGPGRLALSVFLVGPALAGMHLLGLPSMVHPASAQTTMDGLLGCYDVEVEPWNEPGGELTDSLWWSPPPRVELTPSESRMGPGLALRPAPNSLPTPHSQTWWALTDTGTLEVGWGDGFTGMTGDLEVSGDTLEGELRTYRDEIPSPTYRAPVRMVQVDCATPPEFPFENQPFLIRTVQLTDGFTISLGEPIRPRDEILGEFNKTAYFVRRASVGTLGGSRDVRVRVSTGDTVASIRLTYPRERYDELRDRIVAEVGSPNGPRNQLVWRNRMTRIRIHRTQAPASGERPVHVTLTDPRLPYRIPESER